MRSRELGVPLVRSLSRCVCCWAGSAGGGHSAVAALLALPALPCPLSRQPVAGTVRTDAVAVAVGWLPLKLPLDAVGREVPPVAV